MSGAVETPPAPAAPASPERIADGGRARPGARELLSRYGLLIALLLVMAIFSALRPDSFATVDNARAILEQLAPSLILAAGLTVVLTMNDFDLSFGSVINLATGTLLVLVGLHGVSWPVAIVAALAAGALVGVVNGVLIARFGGSSFIITLAMGTLVIGVEYAITGQDSFIAALPGGLTSISQGRPLLGVSNEVWIAFAICAVVWVTLARTELGRFMYAVGDNAEAARLAGVRIMLLRGIGFVIVGLFAAIVGVLAGALSASYTPGAGGSYLLPSYAAVFLGAAAFRPGQFNVPGTVVGVLFLGVIQTGLTMLSLETFVINLVQGSILIAAVLLSRLGARSA